MKIYILRFTCTYEGKKLGGGEGSRWIVLRFFYLLNSVLIAFLLFHFLNIFEEFFGERHFKKTEQRENLH
jgi:hypothetical protein